MNTIQTESFLVWNNVCTPDNKIGMEYIGFCARVFSIFRQRKMISPPEKLDIYGIQGGQRVVSVSLCRQVTQGVRRVLKMIYRLGLRKYEEMHLSSWPLIETLEPGSL